MTSTFGRPYSPSSACDWRLTLETQTSSASIKVNAPTPDRASASAAQEPTPPIPTTHTCARASRATLPVPYRRSMPAKRGSMKMRQGCWTYTLSSVRRQLCVRAVGHLHSHGQQRDSDDAVTVQFPDQYTGSTHRT